MSISLEFRLFTLFRFSLSKGPVRSHLDIQNTRTPIGNSGKWKFVERDAGISRYLRSEVPRTPNRKYLDKRWPNKLGVLQVDLEGSGSLGAGLLRAT